MKILNTVAILAVIASISFCSFSVFAGEIEVLVDLNGISSERVTLHSCAFDGNILYVLYGVVKGGMSESHIIKINPDTGDIEDDIVLEHKGILGSALTHDGEHLVVVINSRLFKLDKELQVIEGDKIPLPFFVGTGGISYDDGKIWAVHNSQDDEITLVDLSNESSKFYFYAPTQIPTGLTTGDGYLWLCDPQNIYKMDRTDGKVIKIIEGNELGAGGFTGLAYGDGFLFVLSRETKMVYKLWI